MPRQFCGPHDALDFLENEWPSHGVQQARAIEACGTALHHSEYTNSAKNSFVAACIEASLACCEAVQFAVRQGAQERARIDKSGT
ncbi:DUF982 domain-containing protein [Sinorhizobium fredii]|uniref:DUF982 domain-containing protein n=1 Tax=Rhizobium fredii TaxID=380 RepID=UPI0009B668A0|nr:DUF982 domain-containing protein [Sinorhizobium fredii]